MIARLPLRTILVTGPSGAGKSTVAAEIATTANLLHFELDQWGNDGVDAAHLRAEWNRLYNDGQPDELVKELAQRAKDGRRAGVVVSLPSLVVLPLSTIERGARTGMTTIILYGTAADCLDAFIRREMDNKRKLTLDYWFDNNQGPYMSYSRPEYARYRVEVFSEGVHRSVSDIAEIVLRITDSNAKS